MVIPMRSTLFVILAVLVVAGGFAAYLKTQGPIARIKGVGAPPPAQVMTGKESVGSVRTSDHPYTKQFDKEGRLISRFRANDVQPLGNGRVHVTDVEAD